MSNQVKVTKKGESVVIDDGVTVLTINSSDLFKFVEDLFVTTECHHILLTAVEVAKDKCSITLFE